MSDMSGNSSLNAAKSARQDEFYTQLSDIENELKHYRKHFKGKTVLCNCDDPFESNFFKYFVLNFNRLKLKKLIATCYAGSPIAGKQLSLFDVAEDAAPNTPYKAVVTVVRDADGDGGIDMFDVAELFRTGENELTELAGDGDFRSDECLALLDEADIVVTNPPFSLFREYVARLVEHEKSFILIGPYNAIKYKELFPLFMGNKMWLGYGFQNGNSYFAIPPENAREFASGVYDETTGLVHFRNVTWFTNLDIKKRHEELVLVEEYDPEKHPTYANYEGIEVSRVAKMPCDYEGHMGVPITFMDVYNPDQFEIVGYSLDLAKPMSEVAEKGTYSTGGRCFYTSGGRLTDKDKAAGYLYHREYDRIVIRNRHPEALED